MATSETTPVGPSLSMRVVIFGIRKRFPSVNHLNCSQAAELSKSQDVIYLVREQEHACMIEHTRNISKGVIGLGFEKNVNFHTQQQSFK